MAGPVTDLEVEPMIDQAVDFTKRPTSRGAVSRRTLIQWCGTALLAPLALSASAGAAGAANGSGAFPAAGSAIDAGHCLAACRRRDQEYALAGEAAFQRNVAAVELRHQQRLALCPAAEDEAAAYRAACAQERAELLEVAYASRLDWLTRREARLAGLLRRCGVREGG
jgi:hypothetical protein